MDEFILKLGAYLLDQGPWAVMVAIMIYLNWKRDKRLDYVTDELIELGKDGAGNWREALTYLREAKK